MMADTMFCLAWICGFDVDWYDLEMVGLVLAIMKVSVGDLVQVQGMETSFLWKEFY